MVTAPDGQPFSTGTAPLGSGVSEPVMRVGVTAGVDVWESAEALQKFMESTLQPTMGKVAAAHGVDLSQAGEPEISITEVHRVVH